MCLLAAMGWSTVSNDAAPSHLTTVPMLGTLAVMATTCARITELTHHGANVSMMEHPVRRWWRPTGCRHMHRVGASWSGPHLDPAIPALELRAGAKWIKRLVGHRIPQVRQQDLQRRAALGVANLRRHTV